MHVEGALQLEDGSAEGRRYMGITANANADTCADQGALWPFTGAAGAHLSALQKADFGIDGGADYESNLPLASLFGANSVIGRSVSLFATASKDSAVQACCVITQVDEATYRAVTDDEDEFEDEEGESEQEEESESDDE